MCNCQPVWVDESDFSEVKAADEGHNLERIKPWSAIYMEIKVAEDSKGEKGGYNCQSRLS